MTRDEKIEMMNEEMRILAEQTETFAKLVKESSVQFENIKKFGIKQTSFFMSAHEVFQKMNEENEGGNEGK